MELRSYNNSEELKQKYIAQLRQHYDADEIIKGQYWEDGKGCAVGCILHSSNHAEGEDLLGLPEWLWRLIDQIFEGLPNQQAKEFPLRFLKSIRVGSDLSRVRYQFVVFLLEENYERVSKLQISAELKKQVLNAIQLCLELNRKAAETGIWDKLAAESVAWSAESVRSAAELTAWSARSAAESVAWLARSAAELEWSAAYERYADKLIELLEAA